MFNVKLYEFLAAPAHIWLWVCAKICGGTFTCGRVEEDDEENG